MAREHSFPADAFSVPVVEDSQTLERLRAGLIADYRPVNSQELFAVERIALAQFCLLRAARLEAGLFHAAGGASPDSEGFQRLAGKSAVLPLFLRYQAQTERHYRRAVEEFNRLKKLRHELPNGFAEAPPEPPSPPTRALSPKPPRLRASPRPSCVLQFPRPAGPANPSRMTAA